MAPPKSSYHLTIREYLGLLTALSQALKSVLQGYLNKFIELSKEFITSSGMIFGSIFLGIFVIINRGLFIPPDIGQFIILLIIGVMTVAAPAYLTLMAYEIIGNLGAISFVDYLLPVFTGVIAYFINQEGSFHYASLVTGFLLIVLGAVVIKKGMAQKV